MWALLLLVAYGIYAYVRSSFHVEPQKKPMESPKEESRVQIEDEEFAEEITQFPQWEKEAPIPELEVPRSYSKDSLVLMVRDPEWLYSYWEVTVAKLQEFKQKYDVKEDLEPVLRIYDVSGINSFDGLNAHSYRDVAVNGYTNNWYINVDGPDRTYCVDYGYKLSDGRFITLLRSNFVSTPRASMSDIIDDQWKPIDELYPNSYSYLGSSK
jgi:hypothetical protein